MSPAEPAGRAGDGSEGSRRDEGDDDEEARTAATRTLDREPHRRRPGEDLLQCRRMLTGGPEDHPVAGQHVESIQISGHVCIGVDGDPVEEGQFAALGVVGIDVGAHLEQSGRVGGAQALEPLVFGGRERFDVLPDVRIDAHRCLRSASLRLVTRAARSICAFSVRRRRTHQRVTERRRPLELQGIGRLGFAPTGATASRKRGAQ